MATILGTDTNYLRLQLDYSYTQNQEGLYTDITASLKLYRKAAGSTTNKTGTPYRLTVAGTQLINSTYNFNIANMSVGGYLTITTKTKRVTHDPDTGVAPSVTLSGFFDLSNTSVGNMSVSGSFTPPALQRASTPSAVDGTIGSVIHIDIDSVNSTYTHVLKATFGGVTDVIANGVGTEYAWTPAMSLHNRIPNDTSGECVITCETYSDDHLFGTKAISITLNADITACTPGLVGSYADTNSTTSNITGDNTLLIKDLSNVNIVGTPSLKYNATISSITIGGVSVTTGGEPYNVSINNINLDSTTIAVTDSRGLTKTITMSFTYAEHEDITFLASFFRTAAMNNEMALQFSGTFYNNNIGITANTISVQYRYKPELGDWSDYIELPVAVEDNNFSNEGTQVVLGKIFDHSKQYMFEIQFIDLISSKTSTLIVGAGRAILKITETVQVLQGKLHIQKLYTKDDKDFVFDFIYDIINRTWIVHVFGLTQMFEPQHIFQSDVNTRSIITVLNIEGYPLLNYKIDDNSENFSDYKNVDEEAIYNNNTMLDTGICPLNNMLEKRAREIQFTTYSKGSENLEFFVSTYIDSRNVSNPESTTIDWLTDPNDPNYGQLYEVEEEVVNVYGETNLNSWLIDYSNFPKVGLVKSHLSLHGKGLFFRTVIINRDRIEHELSGITFVYRIMNAR